MLKNLEAQIAKKDVISPFVYASQFQTGKQKYLLRR